MALPPEITKGALKRKLQASGKASSGNMPPQFGGKSGSKKKAPPFKKKGGKPSKAAIQRRLQGGPTPNPSAPPGQGGRFAAMLAGGMSPGLAASIGRKKYGKGKFQQMSAQGR